MAKKEIAPNDETHGLNVGIGKGNLTLPILKRLLNIHNSSMTLNGDENTPLEETSTGHSLSIRFDINMMCEHANYLHIDSDVKCGGWRI